MASTEIALGFLSPCVSDLYPGRMKNAECRMQKTAAAAEARLR